MHYSSLVFLVAAVATALPNANEVPDATVEKRATPSFGVNVYADDNCSGSPQSHTVVPAGGSACVPLTEGSESILVGTACKQAGYTFYSTNGCKGTAGSSGTQNGGTCMIYAPRFGNQSAKYHCIS